jgi:hypothetical protein
VGKNTRPVPGPVGSGTRTRIAIPTYTQIVFWHLVVSAGHVVHSGASGVHNIDALFFMLEWDRCRFHKKNVETRYAELVFFIRWDLLVM